MTRAKDISKIVSDANFGGTLDVAGAFTQDGGAVFNEASADVDFRVESNTLTHALFVDGDSGYVGIGGLTAPSAPLHILDNAGAVSGATYRTATPLVLENNANTELQFFSNSSNNAQIRFGDGDSNFAGAIEYSHSDNSARIWTNSAEQVRIHSNGVLSAADGVALGVGTANTASNVLDDYEEGVWIPVLNSFTESGTLIITGIYTKIGNLVFVKCTIVASGGTVAGTGGTAYISGLPFAGAYVPGGWSLNNATQSGVTNVGNLTISLVNSMTTHSNSAFVTATYSV